MPNQITLTAYLCRPIFLKGWICVDKNKQTYEYIGKLNPSIAKYQNLEEHANKPIVIYSNRKQHIIDNHLKDFGSIERIEDVWNKLGIIIRSPDDTFYNEKTKRLEYY